MFLIFETSPTFLEQSAKFFCLLCIPRCFLSLFPVFFSAASEFQRTSNAPFCLACLGVLFPGTALKGVNIMRNGKRKCKRVIVMIFFQRNVKYTRTHWQQNVKYFKKLPKRKMPIGKSRLYPHSKECRGRVPERGGGVAGSGRTRTRRRGSGYPLPDPLNDFLVHFLARKLWKW